MKRSVIARAGGWALQQLTRLGIRRDPKVRAWAELTGRLSGGRVPFLRQIGESDAELRARVCESLLQNQIWISAEQIGEGMRALAVCLRGAVGPSWRPKMTTVYLPWWRLITAQQWRDEQQRLVGHLPAGWPATIRSGRPRAADLERGRWWNND